MRFPCDQGNGNIRDYHGFDVNIGEHDWKNGRRAFPRQGDIKNYHDDIGEYYGFDRDIGYRKRRIGMFGNRIVAGGTWVTAPVYYGQAGESANSVRYMRM